MLALSVFVLCYVTLANCLPNGPPICTLMPRHSNLQPQQGDWEEYYEVHMFKINQGRLLDPLNKDYANAAPNGIFFIIQPKNVPGRPTAEIKGFGAEVNRQYTQGVEPITFPMVNHNKKIKEMECHSGAQFLAHRDASPKKRISFFVANNLDYKEQAKRGIKRFRATILENYSKFFNIEF